MDNENGAVKPEIALAVVIVTYNGGPWIAPCLDSLLASTRPATIIVVDNASHDGSAAIIRERYPQVKLLHSKSNLGFGRANNWGIRTALDGGAQAVFLMNQDAKVTPTMLDQLVATDFQHPDAGIISPFHVDYQGDSAENTFSYLIAQHAFGYVKDLLDGKSADSYPINFIHAAGWYLPQRVLEKCGGFDPFFFLYGEDHEYCTRVKAAGFTIRIVPKAIFHHHHHAAWNSQAKYHNALQRAVSMLKRTHTSVPRNLLSLLRWSTMETLASLSRRDIREARAVLRATSGTLWNVRTLARHRTVGMVDRFAFLEAPRG